jgi:2-oxoglutarate dehydrogenase E2 component (dihydrolipoamide succinyltransferase)
MKHNVVAPSVGESITEVSILKWAKTSGQGVKVGELLLEIESDKATVEIVAEKAGVLIILKQAGERIPIGELIGQIDDAASPSAPSPSAPAQTAPTPTAATHSAQPLSPAVRKISTEQGIDPSTVTGTGKDGRVTKGDLLQATAQPKQAAQTPSPKAPADRPGDRRVQMSMLRSRIAERLVL